MLRLFFRLLLGCLVWTQAAEATTIDLDFEDLVLGQDVTGLDLGGVIFSAAGAPVIVGPANIGGLGSQALGIDSITSTLPAPFSSFRADFLGYADTISIDLGDSGGDIDMLFLVAQDGIGDIVDLDLDILGQGEAGAKTLEVSGPNIRRITFGSDGVFPNSVTADNLSFTLSVIPLPGSALLLGSALFAAGILRRLLQSS